MGQPSAVAFAASGLLWLLLCVLPGYLAVTVLDPARSLLDRVAVAPLVSFGVGFAVAAWLGALRVAGSVWYATAALVLLGAGSASVLLRRPRERRWRESWTPSRRRTWIFVGGAIAVSVALWFVAITTAAEGWSSVVPSFDGVTHGMLLTDVLRGGSLYPPDGARDFLGLSAATGPAGVPVVVYPLAVHVIAAPIASLTTVPSALLVPLTIMASAWLVLGSVALTRRFASPDQALAAGAAAAFLAPMLPFWHVYWGPVPMVLSVALVPAAALAVLDVRPRSGLVVPTVAVSGLFALHVTEVLVVAALLAVHQAAVRHEPGWGRSSVRMVAAGVLALVVAFPLTAYLAFAHGASRPAEAAADLDLWEAGYVALLRPYVVLTSASGLLLVGVLVSGILLLMLTVLGACSAWGRPMGKAVVAVAVGCLVAAVLAYLGRAPLLTAPWYRNGDRLMGQVAALAPCLLGLALVPLARRVAGAPRRVAVAGLLTAGAVAVVMLTQAAGAASLAFTERSVVTAADLAAFEWLTAHVPRGERVLNDDTDGSAWMYAASRGTVLPVFGGHPGEDYPADPAYADRLHLQRTIQDVATNAATRGEALRWNVRYVMIGERTIKGDPRLIDAEAIGASDGLREVFSSGGAKVYEIVDR